MKRISTLGLLFVFLGLTINPAKAMVHCNRFYSSDLQSCVSELTGEVEDLKD
ncbi:hypothetical protein [Candidatus Liberibacter brunswickensis]|uniref:hypothetical protein n=1 Tax=Candidatus Liberibacter brunswickensis TaxID=1968796 RepID=UPI002FDF46F7